MKGYAKYGKDSRSKLQAIEAKIDELSKMQSRLINEAIKRVSETVVVISSGGIFKTEKTYPLVEGIDIEHFVIRCLKNGDAWIFSRYHISTCSIHQTLKISSVNKLIEIIRPYRDALEDLTDMKSALYTFKVGLDSMTDSEEIFLSLEDARLVAKALGDSTL